MRRYTYDAIPPHTSVSLDTELHGELVMEQRCSNIPDATGGVLRSEIDSRSKAFVAEITELEATLRVLLEVELSVRCGEI